MVVATEEWSHVIVKWIALELETTTQPFGAQRLHAQRSSASHEEDRITLLASTRRRLSS